MLDMDRSNDGVPTIDVHAHAVVPAALRHNGNPSARLHQQREAATFGAESVAVNEAQIKRIAPLLTDPDARLQAMDAMAVAIQLVSPSPVHYHEWADLELARQIATEVNDGMVQVCAARPERLIGLGTVPVHHPELASAELTRVISDLGLRGVEISTSAGDRELADPALEEFWATAEALGALIFIHPWGCSLGARLDRHYLANVVGNPVETTLALSHIIFSGLLDRHPGLRIIAAHGGGYLPFYIGRSDHAWQHRPDSRIPARAPSEYLRRLYFDSLVYEPTALRALVARAGAGQVLLGSDFPFDMGVEDPVARLEAADGLSDDDREAIRGRTAAGLLGLTANASAIA
jgi:aminocarboxymuconate-semialdehyde decarboxylase